MTFKVIDACNTLTSTPRVVITLNCSEFAAVNSLVIADPNLDQTVEVLTSNVYDGLCVGQIINKPSPTTAEIQVAGVLESSVSDLDAGKPVFVGLDGAPTTTPPTTGGLQVMGVAITSTDYIIQPGTNKVTRL